MAEVFTDGSALDNGRAGARAGIGVYWGPDDPKNISAPFFSWPYTNNRAELYACIVAVQQYAVHFEGEGLRIHTDSMYVVNAMTKWLPSWKRRGWKKSDGKPVENRDLIAWLDSLCQMHPGVTFTHVKAHGKERDPARRQANEMADALANAGAELASRFI